jgi:hypothetical protein
MKNADPTPLELAWKKASSGINDLREKLKAFWKTRRAVQGKLLPAEINSEILKENGWLSPWQFLGASMAIQSAVSVSITWSLERLFLESKYYKDQSIFWLSSNDNLNGFVAIIGKFVEPLFIAAYITGFNVLVAKMAWGATPFVEDRQRGRRAWLYTSTAVGFWPALFVTAIQTFDSFTWPHMYIVGAADIALYNFIFIPFISGETPFIPPGIAHLPWYWITFHEFLALFLTISYVSLLIVNLWIIPSRVYRQMNRPLNAIFGYYFGLVIAGAPLVIILSFAANAAAYAIATPLWLLSSWLHP